MYSSSTNLSRSGARFQFYLLDFLGLLWSGLCRLPALPGHLHVGDGDEKLARKHVFNARVRTVASDRKFKKQRIHKATVSSDAHVVTAL